MPEESPNPNRLIVYTNQPGEAEQYEAKGWIMYDMLVLALCPGKQPDLIDRKLYAIRFWRPEPDRQTELKL